MKALCLALLLPFASAQAADLSQIFPAGSPTSAPAAGAVSDWLRKNCKDLSWALSVKEIENAHQSCSPSVEQVHVSVEMSHLRSEFTFWVKTDEKGTRVDWINEEWPSWHVCSYGEGYFRDDRSCSENP